MRPFVPQTSRQRKKTAGVRVTVTVSQQASQLLQLLGTKGLWGRTDRAVAGRLLEDALVRLFVPELRMSDARDDKVQGDHLAASRYRGTSGGTSIAADGEDPRGKHSSEG